MPPCLLQLLLYRRVEFSRFMAAISNLTRENVLLSRLKLKALVYLQVPCWKFKHTFAECERESQVSADSGIESVVEAGQIDFSKWRKLDSRNFGISRSMIPPSPRVVLKILHGEGFEAYLVGGCVRDLILNRIPKDFDIITNATLRQIKKQFRRCEIVGRIFPICRVHVKGSIVEVSSFDTVAKHAEKEEAPLVPKMPKGCPEKDFILWNNSMHRDFTINSLFFNPFVNRIYDYANAMQDLRSLKLRTLVPAHLSFGEDCARILRGLRLAARLNLSFTKEIEDAMHELSSAIMSLSNPRIMMELNYMMSYGAAEPSLSLLQRYNILEIVLPFHGTYLTQQASKQLGKSSVMLMKLFSSLDQLVTCGQPSHDSVWVALLVFHMALITHPQHVLVILTFASVLYHANWKEAVKFAEKHSEDAAVYGPEFSDSQGSISDDELAKKVAQLAVQVQKSINILTDRDSLLEAMSKFPGAPCSGLVFVSNKMGRAVELMFDILVKDVTSLKTRKDVYRIDYVSLGKGNMCETRFLLGKVILDTIIPRVTQGVKVIKEGKHILLGVDGQQKEDASHENFLENLKLMKLKFVSDDNLLNENYQLQHDIFEKKRLNHEGCSDLVEAVTKKQKIVAAEHYEELAVKKQDLIDDTYCLSQELDRVRETVTMKKFKGEDAQLPKDEIRMLLEEVKYQQHCRDATGKEKKNAVINPLNLLMNNVATKDHKFTDKYDSLQQEHSIDEVNKKLDGENHNSRGKKFASAQKGKRTVSKQSLSTLFR
ncbi:uncharacterized protein LOC125858543 isoform X1 [Solanum stenotomum]|uniref:uncharacterized protein LOC125858543 isoform X1 n=1 Tax=Solanum stenotomum TaxID=172797 RepID=UPI0020D1A816|nr:uncharacterized protein LOC125858543 isoform X1 [Solanum stenotomum]